MIFTFIKMQTLVKRTGMTDVIYFEGTLSVCKGVPERFCPVPQVTFASYTTGDWIAERKSSTISVRPKKISFSVE